VSYRSLCFRTCASFHHGCCCCCFLLLPATVVASTYCELYSLSRADLEEVLQQWPELAEEFEAMGESCLMSQCSTAAGSCYGLVWVQVMAWHPLQYCSL
jgi:hypothetical protein